ncbi:MAG: VWA domain-containing protein [Verrucomicrobiales bacterium]|nr:VWA domain-containing protein [Verrucomicrobiales bacterium]
MNRRLPVYLLIDCSESMIGGGIEAVRSGLATMLSKLRTDPHALDTVHLSVITFDAEARVQVPMTPLLDFQQPVLNIKPGTALGGALTLLADRIEAEVQKTSHTTKGDYRPLVLLLTDGQPNDNWKAALTRIGAQVRPRPANIYAIGCGVDVDYSVLQGITDVVLRMEDMGEESFGKLFVWLTASVSSASQGVSETTEGKIKLEKLPDNVEAVTTPAPSLENGPPRQVFLRARCSVKHFPYLMRYRFDPVFSCYQPVKAHRLSEEDAHATATGSLPDIRSDLLNGASACPWCERPGAGSCGNCGTIFCSDPYDSSETKCPGCGTILKREPRDNGGSGFTVRQSGG